ncbi:hypothetical protein AAG747_08350 [Rapidithrix thailandica]|uniref:Uncharacterized protein n=1 Tax=Rapidithrix thailandica TaxID=413964 RepID=A0AAW9SAI2_9BACT
MAKYNSQLIQALRHTSSRLSSGAKYEWGHMGRCNCGHLVQTVTKMNDREIVQVVNHRMDEWSEHAKAYCAHTGHEASLIFDTMEQMGFSYEDMVHLEYLSDPKVLNRLGHNTYLQHNQVEHVILYMQEMASMLEEEIF